MTETNRTGGAADVNPDILFRDLQDQKGEAPFLGSTEGVEMVVRALAKRVQEFRAAYLEKGKTSSDPKAFAEDEAKAMTDIFYGRNPEYEFTAWNSPDQLGYGFGDRVDLEGDPEDVMNTFWIKFIADLVATMQDHENGLADDAAQFRIESTIEEAVYALLGLPLSAD